MPVFVPIVIKMLIIIEGLGLLNFRSTFTKCHKAKTLNSIMKTIKLKAVLVMVVACLFSVTAMAQMDGGKEKKAPLSPRDSVSGTVNGANININYSSPSVRGRKIWDSLVMYKQVWRTGANEATRFTTDKAIKVEGKTLPAGTYGFFAIPTAGKWTIIFNSTPNQWGAFKYDATKDVLRVMVTPKKAGAQESLIYKINPDGFELDWAGLSVPVKIK